MTPAAVVRIRSAMTALVLAAAALSAMPSLADDEVEPPMVSAQLVTEAAAAGTNEVAVTVTQGPAGLEVVGRCSMQASSATAWSVLTDYDSIDDFVSSMRESRIAGHEDGDVLVDQVAVGRLFLFKRRLHARLRVHEEPPGRIRFEDVLRRDFESYRGEWRIEASGGRVEITYRVDARPAFSVPDFIARGLFRRTVRELLAEVRSEIERREALALR